MPAVAPGSKVLVSGANGFIAVWVVRYLLESGYIVRGTVRSLRRGEFIKNLFRSYGERFELVVVEDITKVNVVAHAVPWHLRRNSGMHGLDVVPVVRDSRWGRTYRPGT